MNSASKIAVVVLLCLIAGCKHKTQAAPPPAAQAPILPPSTIAKDTPLPQLPPPETPKVGPPGSDVAQQPPPPKPRQKTTRHKPKPADQPAAQAAKDDADQQPRQQASAGAAAGDVADRTALQHWRRRQSAEPARYSGPDYADGKWSERHQAHAQLGEQVTATQIRTFLTKAKQALDQDDLDGANTLVTKAKVLLAELTKS